MEEWNIEDLIDQVLAIINEMDRMYWVVLIGGLLVLIISIIGIINRRKFRRRLKAIAPALTLNSFQVSPMGRDAFMKLQNRGEKATLSGISIKGQPDIVVKNTLIGQEIDNQKTYSIFFETNTSQKFGNSFSFELTYLDQMGNVYKQLFLPAQNLSKPPKLVRKR